MTTSETNYAVVTGGGSGLGRALCLRLAADGWTIAVCDRNEQTAQETCRLVEQAGGRAEAHLLDVTEPTQWLALRERLQAEWSRLDLLANNAGVSAGGEAAAMCLDDWQFVLDVNLYGPILGCQTFIPWLIENPGRGHILNTASLAGLISAPGMGPYNVSKAGVVALSETLYSELKRKGVGVTVLCPGFFATNLLTDGRFPAEAYRKVGRAYMDQSRFTADDVARLAIRAMHRKRLYVVHDYRARALWRLKRLAPASFHRLVTRLYHRTITK